MYYIDSPPESKLAHYNQILQPSPDDKFIDMLPAPISFQEHLEEMRRNLKTYPSAFVGEIGLDRSFRIPHPTEMGRHPNRASSTDIGGTTYSCSRVGSVCEHPWGTGTRCFVSDSVEPMERVRTAIKIEEAETEAATTA
ncbi:Cut9-interacting protein scn1 [Neolecta irregularis DAH-3]|uniref:Cut9-interacting protein scn1 n=1 Tax=Neolecta irregularis (strain DAH-3) TaxID=1198029 RepID=A0A1U7LI94_NEOID|nr:Cut9-interacting protein scn1 [Neolecta irregularis DAH-3]|eukprot:OLL22348.1 Cut9-interacting protein scn1 [Neolecta irregularis DAH-3]